MRLAAAPLLLLSVLLAGCATNAYRAAQLPAGATRQQVLERAGPPTRAVPIAGGERLQYSVQPAGPFAWMVDLDGTGRVQRVRQVLNAAEFQRIEPDRWTAADVQREFGPPARIEGVRTGPVLLYRWQDVDGTRMYWAVYLDEAGVVRRSHQGMELAPEPDDRS